MVWTNYAKRRRNKIFFAYGLEFLRVAQKTGSPLVQAYLLGHALELLLKTYLLDRGYPATKLKSEYGHRLSKLLSECCAQGLDKHIRISPQLKGDLDRFSDLYASKHLQYFSILYLVTTPPVMPDRRRIARFTRTLATWLRKNLSL